MDRPTIASRRTRVPVVKLSLAAAALVAALALVATRDRDARATPLTLKHITVDGQFSDWDAVLANGLQTTHDGDGTGVKRGGVTDCSLSADRDCPVTGGSGNDFLAFAWTYDDDYVYLYVERYGSPTNTVDLLFVADVNRDLLLEKTNDRVVHAKWFGSSGTVSMDWMPYFASTGAGDPLTDAQGYVDGYDLNGNNVDPAGVVTAQPCAAAGCLGAGDTTASSPLKGLRVELRIPWQVFGVPAGTPHPFNWHAVSSGNGTLTGTVDNIGSPTGRLGTFTERGVSLYPDRSGAVAVGGTKDYLHTLANDGNDADAFRLSATSSQGAAVSILSGGVALATDSNGDGIWDAGAVPSVALAAGASTSLTVRIALPAGRTGQDVTRVTATSAADATVSSAVTDTTQIGALAFVPGSQRRYTVPAQAVPFPLVLSSAQGQDDAVTLTADTGCPQYELRLALDAGGTPGAVFAQDLDGNGSWDAGPATTVVRAGASTSLHLLVTPKSWVTPGTTCTVTLAAAGGHGASASTAATVSAANAVTFAPDYAGSSAGAKDPLDVRIPPGTRGLFPVVLRNAEATARAYAFTFGQGSDKAATLDAPRIWTDPNGDGNPADGEVVTTSATLSAYGGEQRLVIDVGSGNATNDTWIETVATAAATTGSPRAAAGQRSEAIVGYLGAYKDLLRTEAATEFAPCTTVYLQARGLAANDSTTYALQWVDPLGTAVGSIAPWGTTTRGTADAERALGDAVNGLWKAVLTGTPAPDQAFFRVRAAGAVSTLTTDRPSYSPGDAVAVSAAVRNDGGVPLAATRLVYPGHAHARTADVAAGATVQDPFTFAIDPAAVPGTYTISLGWYTSCGASPIATGAASYAVRPLPPTITQIAGQAPSVPGGPLTNDATPDVAGVGTAAGPATVTLDVDGGAATYAGIALSAGSWSFTVPGAGALGHGTHTLVATQVQSGVASLASAPVTLTVDLVPPDAPALVSPAPPPAAPLLTNALALPVRGTASLTPPGDAAEVELAVSTAGASSWVPGRLPLDLDGAFAGTVTLALDGEYDLAARAWDRAGNGSAASAYARVVLDRIAPPEPGAIAVAGGTAGHPAVSVSGTAEAGATVQVSIFDGDTLVTTVVAARSGATFDASILSLGDGRYRVEVVAVDPAGNVSPAASATLVVDTIVPAPPAFASPAPGSVLGAADVADGWVKVLGTADPGATVTVELSPGGLSTTAVADGAGVFTARFVAAALADFTTYTLSGTTRDAAGNLSVEPSAFISFSLDRLGPPPPVVLQPSRTFLGIAQLPGAALAVSGLAEGDPNGEPVLEVTFAGSTHSVPAAGGAWSTSFDLAALGADPAGYAGTLSVTALDRAGNRSGATELSLFLDWTAPGAPTLSGPPSPTRLEVLTLTGTAPLDATSVAVFDAGLLVTTVTISAGSFEVSLSPAERLHTYTAAAGDAAGNASGPSAPVVILVDRTAPGAASLRAARADTNVDPAFAGTLPDDASWVLLYEGATLVTSVSVPGGGAFAFSIPRPADGAHVYHALAMDLAGNVSALPSPDVAVTVDTVPPEAPSLAAVAADTRAAPAFTGSVPGDAAYVAIYENGTELARAAVPGGGAYEIAVPLPADGAHLYTAVALDAAGNVSGPSTQVTVRVDTVAPPQATLAAGATPTRTVPQLGGTAGGDAVEVAIYEGTTLVTTVAVSGGTFSTPVPLPPDGDHTYTAVARDLAGNAAAESASVTVRVDTLAPEAPVVTSPTGGQAFAPGTRQVIGTAEPGSTVRVTLGGASAEATAGDDGAFTVSIAIPAGAQELSVTATDAAGNTSPATTVSVTARTTSDGGGGGGGCGCGNTGGAPGLLALGALIALAPRRRRG